MPMSSSHLTAARTEVHAFGEAAMLPDMFDEVACNATAMGPLFRAID